MGKLKGHLGLTASTSFAVLPCNTRIKDDHTGSNQVKEGTIELPTTSRCTSIKHPHASSLENKSFSTREQRQKNVRITVGCEFSSNYKEWRNKKKERHSNYPEVNANSIRLEVILVCKVKRRLRLCGISPAAGGWGAEVSTAVIQ